MNLEELKNIVREVLDEQTDDYEKFFKRMLSKTGHSLKGMSPKAKSKFFIAVDKAYKAKNEGKLRGYNEDLPGNQDVLDVDKDGEIEASDLASLRNKKK
jgi:hypothetical protein